MPINTFNSNLRVETNVGGELLDNDEFVNQKTHAEHNAEPQSDRPWATTYVPPQPIYVEDTPTVEPDPKVEAANRRDLKIRNIYN